MNTDGIEMVKDGLRMVIKDVQNEERRVVMEMIDIHITSLKDTGEDIVKGLDNENKIKLSKIITKSSVHTLEVLKDSLTKFYKDD